MTDFIRLEGMEYMFQARKFLRFPILPLKKESRMELWDQTAQGKVRY